MTKRIRRALLFVPGHDRQKIENAAHTAADSVVFDLEDSVAFSRKEEARHTTAATLREINFGTTERLIRINAVSDTQDLWREDIKATIESHPDGYILPKVERPGQIRLVEEIVTRAERKYGWFDGSIRLMAIIETAKGIVNLRKISRKSQRLAALIFGAEDLAGDIGAMRTPDGWEVFYARSAIVIHAKAHGLQAIDTPFVDLAADPANLTVSAEQAAYMGFSGKLVIDPDQIAPVQKAFTPTAEAIQRAQDLLTAYAEHEEQGEGIFAHEGRMVDLPMVRAAKTVLRLAHAAGIDVEHANGHTP